MSAPLAKYRAYEMFNGSDTVRFDVPGVTIYLAADVEALLDDPQALAAYLIERQKGKPCVRRYSP